MLLRPITTFKSQWILGFITTACVTKIFSYQNHIASILSANNNNVNIGQRQMLKFF